MAEQAVLDGPLTLADGTPLVLWSPDFPTGELVDAAADFLPSVPTHARTTAHVGGPQYAPDGTQTGEYRLAWAGYEHPEGPSWYLAVSPGTVQVLTRDEARRERRENRQLDDRAYADAVATFLGEEDGEVPEPVPTRGSITEWSRRSQTRMRKRFSELDYTSWVEHPERPLAMATVTFPLCWVSVCPDSATLTGYLTALCHRYERAYGEPLYGIWKKEFQRRLVRDREFRVVFDANGDPIPLVCDCPVCDGRDDGRAPHVHILMQPPTQLVDGLDFRRWLSQTWAGIVNHPDPVQRELHHGAGTRVDLQEATKCTDPRRTSTYFAKHAGGPHGSKAYQHDVPLAWDGRPGRFWGHWGLAPKIAVREVTKDTATTAGRMIRRYSRAQGVTHQATRPRGRLGVSVTSKYPQVIGLAGAELLASRALLSADGTRVLEQSTDVRYRRSRRRAVRCRNGRGWIMLNNGPDFAVHLGLALCQVDEQRRADANRAELQRVGRWDTPAARARRLAPGPRRDALLSRLDARERVSAPRGVRFDESMFDARQLRDMRGPGSASGEAVRRTCSRCGGRLAQLLAAAGQHVGDCTAVDGREFPASPRARQIE